MYTQVVQFLTLKILQFWKIVASIEALFVVVGVAVGAKGRKGRAA